MKAKIYSLPIKALSAHTGLHAGRRQMVYLDEALPPSVAENVPVLVIPVSSMDKVIERAARALYVADGNSSKTWPTAGDRMRYGILCKVQDLYRAKARAAYKAGGFLS